MFEQTAIHNSIITMSLILLYFVILIASSVEQQHTFCSAFSPPYLLLNINNKNDAHSPSSINHQRYHRKDNVYSSSSSFILPTSVSLITRLQMVENDDGHSHDHNHSREADEEIPDWKKNELKVEFTSLLHQVISITTTSATSDDKEEEDKQNELPSLLTTNIEMILNVISIPDLLEEIITDEINQQLADGEEKAEEISNAINTILTFTETFVEQTASIEDTYKQVLNKIFTSIAPSVGGLTANTSDKKTISIMESELDILLKSESVSFTPGFLRHVEGECTRISNLQTPSSESTKMLQILRVIQTRILEELGKNIGEGAVVLGQLLGYENVNEQLAVLDAGLAVRGIEFARELSELTKEALDGFETVKKQQGDDGVDPELIKSVKLIDERIRSFIDKEEKKAKAFQ